MILFPWEIKFPTNSYRENTYSNLDECGRQKAPIFSLKLFTLAYLFEGNECCSVFKIHLVISWTDQKCVELTETQTKLIAFQQRSFHRFFFPLKTNLNTFVAVSRDHGNTISDKFPCNYLKVTKDYKDVIFDQHSLKFFKQISLSPWKMLILT